MSPLPNIPSEWLGAARDKEAAILGIVADHILSERKRLDLPAPASNSGLRVAARDTAIWLAGEEDFKDKILEYLHQRYAEQPGNANLVLFLSLAYGKHVWPVDADPSEIAKDLIKISRLSTLVSFPTLDYWGAGSCFAVLDRSGTRLRLPAASLTGSGTHWLSRMQLTATA